MAEYRDPTPIDPNKDYQITELAEFIRTKMGGHDVREALALGLERAYEDAATSGNANMEVAQARGSYPTLARRLLELDEIDKEVTAQLAQIESEKVGGGVKAKLEDLSPNVLSAIEGGEGTNFELLSIPQDKSVTPGKTTFVRQSKNLYNQNASIDNVRLDTDGEPIPQSPDVAESDIRTTSDFIPILGDTTYISNKQMYLQVYGEDKNPIGTLRDINEDTPLVSVSLARYVRLTIRKSDKETFQFEKGSVPTEYEPYGLIIKDLVVDGLSKFMTEENEGWAI